MEGAVIVTGGTGGIGWAVVRRLADAGRAVEIADLSAGDDEIAERIRTLGFPAPGSYAQFSKLTSISEPDGVPAALVMVQQLVTGHETLCRTLRAALPLAQQAGDESTVSLLTDRLLIHEKTAWMLRSLLA